jgi:tol-pal system protein YbgF
VRAKVSRPDTTHAQPKTPPEGRGGSGTAASRPAGGDTLVTASRSPAKDTLRGGGGAADTAGFLTTPAPPPEALYRQIYLDYSRRQYQVALDESESFLAAYPDDPLGEEVLFTRGQCLMEQTAYSDAVKEFSTLLQRYPRGKRAPGALLRTAIAYDAMGQKELSAGVARRLVKEFPQSEEAKTAGERFGATRQP